MESLTIGEVAKRSGVGIETIRFYERKGLIEDPPRKWSGYRQYPETTIDRLRFIRKAKELGFTLHEINELLEISADASASCAEVKERAEGKIQNIEQKIQALTRMKNALKKLVSVCDGKSPVQYCPVIASLTHEKKHEDGLHEKIKAKI